ncbi:cysteine dioxygenase [Sphingomonas sp. ID0503]|uniref:cysteine dioxygenase family protein n=1 Tax=Sphingomonas sp. ID0503 TaxID=3399691 RepID=UPI003AFA30B1
MPAALLDRPAAGLSRLRGFVRGVGEAVAAVREERGILEDVRVLLGELVARDDWLPDAYAEASPEGYRQYLLHCDSRERFSVVSFVWGPGQSTPIHDHRIWGLVGVLRGAERVESFRRDPAHGLAPDGSPQLLNAGEVDSFSPRLGDIHRVSNAYDDRVSISIHVYGANIGAVERSVFGEDGQRRPFVSGYANATLPNLWNPSL